MKITDYPRITEFTSDQVLLVDGTNGTKTILLSDAILAALDMTNPINRRRVFRGKNLGTSLTSEQHYSIQDGTFKDMWLGDYWVINGVNWRIVDFDYWLGVGQDNFSQHHVVIMPDTSLVNGEMNSTSTTSGGYTGSTGRTTHLATCQTTCEAAFPNAILTHKEFLVTTVTNGVPSAGTWTDSRVELPNEPMIFGTYVMTPASTGTVESKRYTSSVRQLALFNVYPEAINSQGQTWLRDVASATHFCRLDVYGSATSTGAANSYGFRPVFMIG